MTDIPNPSMFAGKKKPEPERQKPVKRKPRRARLLSHVDEATLAALKRIAKRK